MPFACDFEVRNLKTIITALIVRSAMTEFSIGERLLLHLYKYRRVDPAEYFNIPWDLTQDGVASSLRISRAHASLELKKQRERGNVREDQVRIKGGKVKRKCYSLTHEGLEAARKVEAKVAEAGLEVDSLLDLKRQDPEVVFENLPEKDRFALGCACVFRMSVPMSIIPDHERSVIPTDVLGHTAVSRELCARYLDAFPDQAREWHAFAADYWTDQSPKESFSDTDREMEMIYHLIGAGRNWEACKIIVRRMDDICVLDDLSLDEAIVSISRVKDDLRLDVLTVQAEVSINQGWLDKAEGFANALIDTEGGDELGHAFLVRIYEAEGKHSDAEAIATRITASGNVLAALMLAEAHIELCDIERAEKEMDAAASIMSRNNVAAAAQHLYVRTLLAKEKGDLDEARRLAVKVGEAGGGRWKARSAELLKELDQST